MNIGAIRKRVFDIISPSSKDGDKISVAFDIFIILLVIINVGMVVAESFNEFETQIFRIIEIISVIIFTIEYTLRLWTAKLLHPDKKGIKALLKYMFSFMALIDLAAMLPFYLAFLLPHNLVVLRSLRAVRLLRLAKIIRYTNITSIMGTVFKKKAGQVISSTFVVFLLMVMTSVLMYYVENAAQPDKFSNAFDSLWWTIATITTVGYGDIYPITVFGKILSGVIAFLSIGLIAVPTSIISAGYIEHVNGLKDEEKENEEKKCYCPYCGKKLEG